MPSNNIVERLMRMSPAEIRRPALASATGRLSYGELREGMLASAGWLAAAHGVRRRDRIAICLPKTLDTIQMIWGILALGATYVPLQHEGVPARLNRVLASLQPSIVLTTQRMAEVLVASDSADPWPVIAVDEGNRTLDDLCRGVAPARSVAEVAPEDLALIFFTSGSTGEPKGVMWSQRNMAAALAALPRWRQQGPDDRLITMAPLQYSASGEMFYPIFSGASAYVCDEREALFPDRLAQILEEERITLWSATATALRLLVENGALAMHDLRHLRRVEIYGERMPMAALRAAMTALPGAEFYNLYSASEAYDMLEYSIPRPLPVTMEALPLGLPTPICRLDLRDEAGRIVAAMGQAGEICVAGPHVFAGYWNDAVQSEARRVPGLPDSYRTGDLAMLGRDGLYHFVGRKDHQVKVRGHRFDLGEIEATAKRESRLREAVAIAIGDGAGAHAIVLAVLVDPGTDDADLRAALDRIFAARLPRFARPGRIERLREFPLLPSGKIDRKAIERLLGADTAVTVTHS